MPSIYRPRRPRASPLWQVVHHAWPRFLRDYESLHRKIHGPLRTDAVAVVDQFYKCGDLAAGFTRLQCPAIGPRTRLKPPRKTLNTRKSKITNIFRAFRHFRGYPKQNYPLLR